MAIVIGALALWYTRAPPEENLIPAIVVSIVPAAPLSPMENDQPVAAEQTTHIDPTPEPSKVETKVEPPPEEIKPPPPRPAEIALPKPEPKPVERKSVEKRPVEKRRVEKLSPPQEAHERAAAREASRQSSVAASNNYNSLVIGQLERAKGYPPGGADWKNLRGVYGQQCGQPLGCPCHEVIGQFNSRPGSARHRAACIALSAFPAGDDSTADIVFLGAILRGALRR